MSYFGVIWRVVGAVVVVAGSFWLTLAHIDMGKSTIEVGYDRPAEKYKAGIPGTPPSPDMCATNCEKDESCTAWVYINVNPERPVPACLFLPAIPAAVKNSCCTSGVVRRSYFQFQ